MTVSPAADGLPEPPADHTPGRRLVVALSGLLWLVMLLGRTRVALALDLESLADRRALWIACALQVLLLSLRHLGRLPGLARRELDQLRAMSRRRLVLRALFATCSFAASVLLVEVVYRLHAYRQFVAASYGVTIISTEDLGPSLGAYRPDLDLRWWQFDPDHVLVHSARARTNNYGFVSHHDYALPKPATEYRIAVLGDSLTACVTNDVPWCDELEARLDADVDLKRALGVERITVLNFGRQGAGFHLFARQLAEFATPFAPDLVLVNYIEDDFARERTLEGLLVDLPERRAELRMSTRTERYVQVREARIRVIGANTAPPGADGEDDPLAEPGAVPGGVLVIEDEAVARDKARIDAIKGDLARRYLRPRLLRSMRLHVLDWALGRPFSLSYAQQYDTSFFEDREAAVEHARAGIAAIRARHPRVLLLRNPLYDDLVNHRAAACTERLQQVLPEQEVVRMERYLPAAPQEVVYRWFNLPADGHWSNAGVKVYAAAIHAALLERTKALAPAR